MPILAIIFGVLLDVLGVAGYYMTGAKSMTALIPSIFGTILVICGVIAKVAPGSRKHVMHVAALVGLIGTVAGLGRGLMKISTVFDGTAQHSTAIWMQLAMGVLSLLFVILCVKSFIDARRNKPEQYGA